MEEPTITTKLKLKKKKNCSHSRKVATDYGWDMLFKYYMSRVTENIPSYKLKKSTARKAIGDINEEIMKFMILKNTEFIPPAQLGTFSVVKKKTKIKLDADGNVITSFLPVNWPKTKQLWAEYPEYKAIKKLVYETNEHFNNYKCTFLWCKQSGTVKNKAYYQFVPTRQAKRMLSYAIKNIPGIDYFEF